MPISAGTERRRKILIFGLLVILAALFIAPPGLVERLQTTQEALTANELGVTSLDAIRDPAVRVTGAVVHAIDLRALLNSDSAFFRQRGALFAEGLYAVIWRIIYFGFVVLLSSGVLAAAFRDGWARRRVTQWRYELPSPTRGFVAHNTAVRMVEFLLLIAVLPIPVPPLALLPWLILFGIAIRMWAANLQKRM